MKFCLFTNVVSPHQLPLARELVGRLGAENFLYVYTQREDADHAALKFTLSGEPWMSHMDVPGAREALETADVLLSGLRDFDLFERRAKKGLKNFYMSERWFKPPLGALRLLYPRYLGYARQIVKMAKDGAVAVLPIGVHARRDFARLGVPETAMTTWGYYVAPSARRYDNSTSRRSGNPLRVMWCGRPLGWKRVDTVRSAVAHLQAVGVSVSLDIYTDLSLEGVREEMRRHDVLVLASNAYEGWGAVVSEALEEGMRVIGTYEAGASATLLPKERLFHAGDYKALARLLEKDRDGLLPACGIGKWTASCAADRLLALVNCEESC